jgi:hypothetical protein
MDQTKITLSEQEHRLMMDPLVILTKNRVIEKVYELFGGCSRACMPLFTLHPEVGLIPPKIAKGEAYKGLPYVMLDYPRYFTSQDVLAIRTFFWWGNYIAVTLHVKGRFMSYYHHAVLDHFELFKAEGYLLSVGDDEWDHDLTGKGYLPLSKMKASQLEDRLVNGFFLKLCRPFSLITWDELPTQLGNTYKILGRIIDPGV